MVLAVLLGATLIMTLTGLSIGLQNDQPAAVVIGLLFGLASVGTVRSLAVRLQVPRRWRDAAVVRGRASVAIDAQVARATDRALTVAEPALYVCAGAAIGVLAAAHRPSLLPSVLLVGLALAVRRERARRRRRP